MYNQSFKRCRGCGKQILWTKTAAGRPMPCDPELLTFTRGGSETFITPGGETVRGTRTPKGELGYIPHWATCPDRERFKKGAKQDG